MAVNAVFDPEASARLTGHEHEIPPNVRRLSADEVHALFPNEFHLLRGRATCGCPEKTVEAPVEAPMVSAWPEPRVLGGVGL